MRLGTVEVRGELRLVSPTERDEAMLVDLNRAYRLLVADGKRRDARSAADWELPASLLDFLRRGPSAHAAAADTLAFVDEQDVALLLDAGAVIAPGSYRFHPVLPRPPKLLCVGRNYADHAAEGGRPLPEVPILFSRFPESLVGHREPMILPAASPQLDWEGELAVVIGTHGWHVPRERALEIVAGYTVFNDGSVRDYQHRVAQWTAGKNFWRTGPLGPFMVSRDVAPDVRTLELTTRLNGEIVQRANTGQMIFDVETLIAHITEWIPLAPGDVIATGTPAGVGNRREPPRFLVAGDTVTVSIEGIGALENPVVEENGGPSDES